MAFEPAYVKYLLDRLPDVSGGQRKFLAAAAQHYGLPVDYPRPEFNYQDRLREVYEGREDR